jgi:hypothetical protein
MKLNFKSIASIALSSAVVTAGLVALPANAATKILMLKLYSS